MLWVTWRQHRGLLVSVPAAFIVAMIVMLIEGQKLHQDYATLVACRPAASPLCTQLSNFISTTDWHEGNGVRVAILAAPALLAMFAGPPVVARELENATFRYTWTQGIGRIRWTVAKLAFIGGTVTILALAAGLLFAWFFAPFLAAQHMSALTPTVFDARGPAYAAWTLTAFCLGAFFGTLVRRVLPAMAVTLGCYAALTAAAWFYLHDHYPVSTFWPMQFFESGWLLALSALLVAATIRLVRRHAI